MGYCVVLVTVPDREQAQRIAETLIAERLAACVNVVPGVWSIYHWRGKVERAAEELLLVKTRETHVARVAARVREIHPYEVPEIIALPVTAGSQAYLDWLEQETGA